MIASIKEKFSKFVAGAASVLSLGVFAAPYVLPAADLTALADIGPDIADSLFGMLVGISLALVALFVIRWGIGWVKSLLKHR